MQPAQAWFVTRPISRLRTRASQLLREANVSNEGWPVGRGEVGHLGQAFAQVIEQRQQKQDETQALLSQIQAVLDHADIGIALTRNGRFELVSKQFCEVLGFTPSGVIGQATSLIHPSEEAYNNFAAKAHPAFMRDGTFNGEVELVRSDGSTFWGRLRGRAVLPGDRSRGTIWTVEDISTSREERQKLTWTSNHDSLTGLENRSAFEALLEAATLNAASEPFCAMFIDLDRFKKVNDTGGHAAGDALLRDIAHTLVSQVRQADTVARLGGDEFAILLRGCPLSRAIEVGETLRKAVQDYRLVWADASFSVGASIGLVAVDGAFADAAQVLRSADEACYAAKAQGRNVVSVFSG